MGSITEIVEESKVLLEIIESGGGQIEIIDNNSTQLEIVESESSIDSTTLDITPQINTVIVDSPSENTIIDILINDPVVVETFTTDNVIEIVEDQVVYQTGSIVNNIFNSFPTNITQSFITESITQSISQSFTTVNGDTVFEGGIFVESGGLFQNVTQSGNDFTDPQIIALKNLIFTNGNGSLSVDTSNPEKNVAKNITFTYSVTLNDDTLSSAEFDGIDVTDNPNGSQLYEDRTSTFTKAFNVTFAPTSTGTDSRLDPNSKTVTFHEPQYFGIDTTESFEGANYSDLNSKLSKKVQGSDSITLNLPAGTVTKKYIYFLSTNPNATIIDHNPFNVTADFQKTTITVKYANDTNQTLYQYRTLESKSFAETISYNIT
tara:strand:- start:16061 stop:17188 length:1128 start_codon:yes stop_codon:yes gene_type:complete